MALDLKNDPDLIAKYRYYHTDEGIWQEIKDGTRNVGIEMEIYNLDNSLFMICEMQVDVDFDIAWVEMNKGEKILHGRNSCKTTNKLFRGISWNG